MDGETRKKMLHLVEVQFNPEDETPEDVKEEAQRVLSDAAEDYLEEWDDFARERWHETNVGDYSPDHVVLKRRDVNYDVQDLPEYDDFQKVADSVAKDMLEALRTVQAAETKASNLYFMARKRLVEAARRLPGASKRQHHRTFKDDY